MPCYRSNQTEQNHQLDIVSLVKRLWESLWNDALEMSGWYMRSVTALTLFRGMSVYSLHWPWIGQMNSEPFRLYMEAEVLETTVVGTRLCFGWGVSSTHNFRGWKNQQADALSRLNRTGTSQTPIQDEIPVLCIITSILLWKRRRALYMQEIHVINDDKCIGIPELYAIATSTDTMYDIHRTTGQEFIHEQTKGSYFHQ